VDKKKFITLFNNSWLAFSLTILTCFFRIEKKEVKPNNKPASKPAAKPAAKPTVKKPTGDEVEFLSDEEELDRDMNAMGLSEKKKEAPEPLAKIPNSKRINIMEEYQKRSGEKSNLNVIFIGNMWIKANVPMLTLLSCRSCRFW
jgi:hypothetical protein